MGRNGLPGGAVRDPASDQNFRALDQDDKEFDERLISIEKEGLPPSGKAGGVLKGSYPNPEFATPQATKAELENEEATRASAVSTEKAARESADTTLTTSIATEKSERETGDNERVKGPAGATESDIAVFNGTTGKVIKDGGKTVAQVLDRANHTGTQLASTISNFDTQVRTSSLNQMTAPTTNLSINSHKLTNVLDPTENLDAANKEYVDAAAAAAAAGLSIKNPVAYASTANITGFTEVSALVLEKTAPLEIDGAVSPPVGTRLLLKNQTTEKRNGLWEVTKNETFGGEGEFGGGGKFGEGSKIVLTRTSDADTEAEVRQGMFILVTLGSENKNTTWILTTANPIVIGTTAQVFAAFTAQPIGPAGGDFEGTFPNPTIKPGAIVNADVNAAAAIAYSKLNLAEMLEAGDLGPGIRNYGIVEALPTSPSPVKGDMCTYIADKTNGVFWALIYDEGEFPWKKIGGSRLHAFSVTLREQNKTTYTSLPTDPLSITLPLKGDYDVTVEGDCGDTFPAEFTSVWLSYAVGATEANDNWGCRSAATSSVQRVSAAKTYRQTGLAASTKLEEKGKNTKSMTAIYVNRHLWADPVRVG